MKPEKTLQKLYDEFSSCLEVNILGQYGDLMVRSFFLLGMMFALLKIHWCYHLRPGELDWMDPVEEFLAKDVSVNVAFC